MRLYHIFILAFLALQACAQNGGVPRVYSNMAMTGDGKVYFFKDGEKIPESDKFSKFTHKKMCADPIGTETGIRFDFQDTTFNGLIYYGLIKHEGIKYPQAVFFKRNAAIKKGKAKINIKKTFRGKYDFIGWEESGKIRLGYRVVNEDGTMLYDGVVNLLGTGPFKTDICISEGPFINKVNPDKVTINFWTNKAVKAEIVVEGRPYADEKEGLYHEIEIDGLQPSKKYEYTVNYGPWSESYHFTTAPEKGSRKAFTFAYTSDSREGQGGGERALYGSNAYMMKKMVALAAHRDAAFFQFTGDMINGYRVNIDQQQLEYTNWKNSVANYWKYAPIYVGMGNHEALMTGFEGRISVDRFPFETESAEALFNKNFCNPLNGPDSEDGAIYDPHPKEVDFPSYKENVFYYVYDNVAMIVLNSDYWYAPSTKTIPLHSGNLHGYIMDQQLDWYSKTIDLLEKDEDIDHVFVTLHTPAFPNGGHAKDDMWYHGDNSHRAYVGGKALEKGIIERRDEFLDISINKSSKCLAILHGDEHNYSRLLINDKTPIYPDNWDKERLDISRPLWQITNGAAGAPYYSQEELPWSDFVEIFSTLNALMLVHVDGKTVEIEVINPDTFEEIERLYLRK